MNDELEKETKEKAMLGERLQKKKEDVKKLREQLLKIQTKKVVESSVQCNMEKEEKIKYHSRPKVVVTKMISIFEEVIHGTSSKKIPTTKVTTG